MIVKTITCHDVYNVGASLQAYALAEYLNQSGCEAEIINYKPDYLAHYELFGTISDRFNRPVLKQMYYGAKLPLRLMQRATKRKREFDKFTNKFMPLTAEKYTSFEDLKSNPPKADVFFAGSDQIWNTVFNNGKDPSFYLYFAPGNSVKASYAASLSTEKIEEKYRDKLKTWLSNLDYISVRELSGKAVIKDLVSKDVFVNLDPVFLLKDEFWRKIKSNLKLKDPYILVYDFDGNNEMYDFARKIAKKTNKKVYSVFFTGKADKCFRSEGPLGFLDLVCNADFVVSNSFHATAFSLIFQRPFVVFNRVEKLNIRMRDLLQLAGLDSRLINNADSDVWKQKIDYSKVAPKLEVLINESKRYIDMVLESVN